MDKTRQADLAGDWEMLRWKSRETFRWLATWARDWRTWVVLLAIAGQCVFGNRGLSAKILAYGLAWLLSIVLARIVVGPGPVFRILVGATGLRFFYAFFVPCGLNSANFSGHYHYIVLLAQRGVPPGAGECWQCYQPPFYYYPAAALLRLAPRLGADPLDIVRLFGLLMSCGFLVLGAKAIDVALESSRHRIVGICLFAFWPLAILSAPVIGNDVPESLFGAGALLALFLWFRRGGRALLLLSACCGTFSILSKSNGVLYLALLPVAVFVAHWREHGFSRMLRLARSLGILAACLLPVLLMATAANLVRSHHAEKAGGDWLVGNIDQQRRDSYGLEFSRDPLDFLPGPSQLRELAANPSPDYHSVNRFSRGFWTVFVRSGLVEDSGVGDHVFAGHFLVLALTCMVSLLVALAIRGLFQRGGDGLLPGIFAGVFLVSAMVFRWIYPFASSADFRYVLGVVIPGVVLVSRGLDSLSGWTGRICRWGVQAFIAGTIVLYAQYPLLWNRI